MQRATALREFVEERRLSDLLQLSAGAKRGGMALLQAARSEECLASRIRAAKSAVQTEKPKAAHDVSASSTSYPIY